MAIARGREQRVFDLVLFLRFGPRLGPDVAQISTTKVVTPELLSEVLEIAAEKRAAEIISIAQRIGLRMPDDAATQFARERTDFGDFEVTEVNDVHEMPRLVFSIAPQRYDAERLTIEDCLKIVRTAQVQARGWLFPYAHDDVVSVGPRSAYVRGDVNFTGIAVDHLEGWRMYRSGQFLYRRMPWEVTDKAWQDKTRGSMQEFEKRQLSAAVIGFLAYELLLFTVTEAYIFASRLAQAALYDTPVDVRVGLHGAKGFALASGEPGPVFQVHLIKNVVPLEDHATVALDKLIADPRGFAALTTIRLFQQFGWMHPPSRETLAQLQLQYYR
jgi:hypothetical protein